MISYKLKCALTDLVAGLFITFFWLCHLLFIGWWRCFTSKETFVLNTGDDVSSMKHTSHNRYVNEVIDDLILRHSKRSCSGCSNPITVIHRDSACYLTDVWIIKDKFVTVVIRGSQMKMTIYPL